MCSLPRSSTVLGTGTTRNDEMKRSTNTTARELRSSVYNHSPGPTLHSRTACASVTAPVRCIEFVLDLFQPWSDPCSPTSVFGLASNRVATLFWPGGQSPWRQLLIPSDGCVAAQCDNTPLTKPLEYASHMLPVTDHKSQRAALNLTKGRRQRH